MTRLSIAACIAGLLPISMVCAGCAASKPPVPINIEFTRLPPFEEGSSDKMYDVEGIAHGVTFGEKVVLYARSGVWWVQPTAAEPLTSITEGGRWRNKTHPGAAYAALLVRRGFRPPPQLDSLPEVGSSVLAIAKSEGDPAIDSPSARLIHFSGYDWQVRTTSSSPGGTLNQYAAANVWTDPQGLLHMKIAGPPGRLKSSEIFLNRSLAYGTYRFIIRDVAQLDPSAVFSMTTWDGSGPWREMDIEISHWGQRESRNGQFVIQPYYIPANTFRFSAPAGRTTFMLRWSPEKAEFKAFPGSVLSPDAKAYIAHVFTSAVPPAGDEKVHLNLYVFGNEAARSLRGAEVIVESFEFLP